MEAVQNKLKDFLLKRMDDESKAAWLCQSAKFKVFWNDSIMNDTTGELTEDQVIPILQILDKNDLFQKFLLRYLQKTLHSFYVKGEPRLFLDT